MTPREAPAVARGLDAVPVGVEQEAAVVVGAVLGRGPGRRRSVAGVVPACQKSSTFSRDDATKPM